MAAGDPVNDIDNVGTTSGVEDTPAAGQVWKITAFGDKDAVHNAYIGIKIGALYALMAASVGASTPVRDLAIYVDNNTSLYRYNASGAATRDIGYSGIRIK